MDKQEKKVKICFDVDMILLEYGDTPRYGVINLLIGLQKSNNVEIYAWSGGEEQEITSFP